MNPQLFIYRVFHLSKSNHSTYCGVAFPITANGDFLTCYHVLNQTMEDGDRLVIQDNETGILQTIEDNVLHSPEIDCSVILNALRRDKREYLPILEPVEIIVGNDVYTYGYYKNRWNEGSIDDGFFKGHIVNMKPNSLAHGKTCLTTSFAIIEGLSGSPLMTYHNGVKLVGLNLGNNQHMIQQSIVCEYEDDKGKFQETTSRIIEHGISLHPNSIIAFLNDNNVEDYTVTSQRHEVSE